MNLKTPIFKIPCLIYKSKTVYNMKRECIENTIDWYKEKDFLEKSLKNGVSIQKLADNVYHIPWGFVKQIIVYLGLLGDNQEDLVNDAIRKFASHGPEYPATDKYLRDILRKNIFYRMWWVDSKRRNIIHRDDYISHFLRSHDAKQEDLWKYDFSQLPEIIEDKLKPVTIRLCFYKSEKTGKEVWGPRKITWRGTIYSKSNPFDPVYIKNKELVNQCVIAKYEDTYGDDFEFSMSMDDRSKMIVKCKHCGKVFTRSRSNIYGSEKLVCPGCEGRTPGVKCTTEDFIRKALNVYGEEPFGYDRVVYDGVQTKVEILDKSTNEYFWVTPANFLHGTCKGTYWMSSGERSVKNWLNVTGFKETIDYDHNKNVYGIRGKQKNMINVDFILRANNKVYWIEYNGIQHYEFTDEFHDDYQDFLLQVRRDSNEKDYCSKNDIIFIPIPYTYGTYEKISNVLRSIIIDGQSVDIIKQVEVKL